MKRGLGLLALLLLGGLAVWQMRPVPARAPIVVVPHTVTPERGRFAQLLAPRIGAPGAAGRFEQSVADCLAAGPDFVLVTGACTAGPAHLALFQELLGPFTAAGVPVLWLAGRGDADFSGAGLLAWASLRTVDYGPLRLVGCSGALLDSAVVTTPGRRKLAERLLTRLEGELLEGEARGRVLFHSGALGKWDAALRARFEQLAAPAFLRLSGAPGEVEGPGLGLGEAPGAFRMFHLEGDSLRVREHPLDGPPRERGRWALR